MKLTEEQEKVCESVILWINKCFNLPSHDPSSYTSPFLGPPFLTIGGYAGTGKTTLIAELRKRIEEKWKKKRVAFVTFTGKASAVLNIKLNENQAIYDQDHVGTIHSLIYRPRYEFDPEIGKSILVAWEKLSELDLDLIIIDEASMVSKIIWDDLRSFDIPIVAVGDHGQLPPIEGNFNLMENLNFELKNIHRQAASSPIIPLSVFVRQNGFIPPNTVFSKSVFKLSSKDLKCQKIWDEIDFDETMIVLCGFNKTRVKLNNLIRQRLGFTKLHPYPGERLICLKNNPQTKLMNGQIGTLMWLMPHTKNNLRMTLQMDGFPDPLDCLVNMSCFGQESYEVMFDRKKFNKKIMSSIVKGTRFHGIDFFDWGYSTSVHKSQGAEWPRVVLFEQRSRYWDDDYYKRWLYTAVTRAKERLFIISDFY